MRQTCPKCHTTYHADVEYCVGCGHKFIKTPTLDELLKSSIFGDMFGKENKNES